MTQTTQQTLTPAEIARVFALYYNPEGVIEIVLTSLEYITDEDAVQVAKMLYCTGEWRVVGRVENGTVILFDDSKRNMAYLYTDLSFGGADHEADYFNLPAVHSYLISKGYAVPLWFGIDHWANGKTAIELGIAVEKETI